MAESHRSEFQGFQDALPLLSRLILAHEADPFVGTPCSCGQGLRTTQCDDCASYPTGCNECFIADHRNHPFHWARVWDSNQGFFVRKDISTLRPQGYAIHLGHGGDPCPNHASNEDMDRVFTVVTGNGIHTTQVQFCMCDKAPNRPKQLLGLRLFPATFARPTMAFSFELLDQFQNLRTTSADAFIRSLRRLTDNAFNANVPVKSI